METNEIKNLEKIRKLSVRYFNTLKHIDKTNIYTAEIRVLNYYELAYVFSNTIVKVTWFIPSDKFLSYAVRS